jgi:tetrahydromethanopterin S-methyltransferase subunit A
MAYIALRDFDKFKKGDLIPNEVVEDRLIRGKKIGLVDSIEVEETKEILNEVVETELKEEILTEDSSEVSIEIKEEDIEEVKVPKKRK